MKYGFLPVWILGICIFQESVFAQTNLIRNGSFEGGLLYWHDHKGKEIVEGGKVGPHAFKINSGWTLSAPIPMERNESYTISLWARAAEGESRVSIGMPPMAREVATNAGRIWTNGATQGFPLTTEWQRISVTFKADVKTTGFWPSPNYGVYIGVGEKKPPVLIDGVTVIKGETAAPDYIPRSAVEVVAERN